MDGHLQALLRDFSKVCTHESMQEDDWQRLYQISLYAYAVGTPPASTIKAFLVKNGCSMQKANFVSHQYHHLTTILRLHDTSRSS